MKIPTKRDRAAAGAAESAKDRGKVETTAASAASDKGGGTGQAPPRLPFISSQEAAGIMLRQLFDPPPGGVKVPVLNRLEHAAWRTPDGMRRVLLISDQPAYWGAYWGNPPTPDTTPTLPAGIRAAADDGAAESAEQPAKFGTTAAGPAASDQGEGTGQASAQPPMSRLERLNRRCDAFPIGGVPCPLLTPLEELAWRTPDGKRHVLLVTDHPAYWAFYWANPPTRDTTPIIPDETGADD
jgi:hypothetical protein